MKSWHLAVSPAAGRPRAARGSTMWLLAQKRRVLPVALASIGLAFLAWGTAVADAAESLASTGLASPPAWAVGRRVHFYPSSAAASSLSGGLSVRGFGGPPPPNLSIGPLLYNEGGGGVQHSPHVYAIFWGSNWGKAPGAETKTEVLKLYEGLSKTAYEGILTQYFDATGRVGSTVAVTSYTDTGVGSPTALTDAKVQAEVAKAIEVNKWTVEINNQFVVLAAPGSTYEESFTNRGFCAYHGLTSEGTKGAVYTFVPYQGDEPFSANCLSTDREKSPVNKTSKSASHEFAESATDPDLNTWHTPIGEEVADLCSEELDLELPSGAWAQNQYDDHVNGCSHEDLEPPHVYAISKLPSEVTTSEAKLAGTVNPEGVETKYYFEYGTTKAYGSKTAEVSAGSSVTNQAASATIKGLTTKTEYHVRVVATNSTGTTPGKDKTFTTS